MCHSSYLPGLALLEQLPRLLSTHALSYQSFHFKLLRLQGDWQFVQHTSQQMCTAS